MLVKIECIHECMYILYYNMKYIKWPFFVAYSVNSVLALRVDCIKMLAQG